MAKPDDPEESRSQTDATLRRERDRADQELVVLADALREDAHEVIRRARARARAILDLAREREDEAMDRTGMSFDTRRQFASERDLADAAFEAEHAESDAALRHERARRRRAVIQLLAFEREETDRMLDAERGLTDQLVAVRDDLLAVVSHDLRNYLNVVLIRAAGLVERYPDDPELVVQADAMQRAMARMDRLLGDLLDLASTDAGQARTAFVGTDLVHMLSDEVAVHQLAASALSVQLSFEAREQPIMVEIEPSRMPRVVMNLISNALKFTPPGGHVEVIVERQGAEAQLSVRDTGPGIAAEELETVFERFHRGGRSADGHGLGLYIARSIVNAHGGRIWVESTPGEGATFRIRLPLAPTANGGPR
jgi:signal transduction histidine kinase